MTPFGDCLPNGFSDPHGPNRKYVQGPLIAHNRRIAQSFDQVPAYLSPGWRHQPQPEAGQIGCQDRDRYEPATQTTLSSVFAY